MGTRTNGLIESLGLKRIGIRNVSGFVGVSVGRDRVTGRIKLWVASCLDGKTGRQLNVAYSVSKNGFKGAFRLAVTKRSEWILGRKLTPTEVASIQRRAPAIPEGVPHDRID
jgi:hypothetical protein